MSKNITYNLDLLVTVSVVDKRKTKRVLWSDGHSSGLFFKKHYPAGFYHHSLWDNPEGDPIGTYKDNGHDYIMVDEESFLVEDKVAYWPPYVMLTFANDSKYQYSRCHTLEEAQEWAKPYIDSIEKKITLQAQ